jgi:CelD/BcsL family acetyltransferase involved in cellulose biosynthesis
MSRDAEMKNAVPLARNVELKVRWRTPGREASSPSEPLDAGALEVVRTGADLRAIAGEWQALERSTPAHAVFQTYDWCEAWYRRYAELREGVRLHVIVGRRDGRIVFIWPLMATRHGPVWILKWLSDPFAQYGDVIVDPADAAWPWLEAAWGMIRGDSDIDGISLRHVRVDAAAHSFLARHLGAPVAHDEAPYLDLGAIDGIEAYHAALSRNQRAKRAKLRKRIEADGEVTFAVHRSGAGLADAISTALDFKREWLAARGYRTDVLLEPGFEAFVRELGHGEGERMTAAAGVMSRNGVPLSVDLGLHFKGSYFGYLIVQDQSLLDESPAKLHLDLLQKWTVEQGFHSFDLMLPSAPYKLHWANGTIGVDDFAHATSFKGHAYCGIYLKVLRPRVKQLYHALPAKLRRPLVDLLRAGRGKTG